MLTGVGLGGSWVGLSGSLRHPSPPLGEEQSQLSQLFQNSVSFLVAGSSSSCTSERQGQLSIALLFQHIIQMGLCGNMGNGHHHRPHMQQDHGPRHDQQQQLGPRCHHDPKCSTGLLDWHGPSSSVVPRNQHVLMWWPRPREVAWAFNGNSSHRQQSTQTLAVGWTLTKLLATASAPTSVWPWVAVQATPICMTLEAACHLDANMGSGKHHLYIHSRILLQLVGKFSKSPTHEDMKRSWECQPSHGRRVKTKSSNYNTWSFGGLVRVLVKSKSVALLFTAGGQHRTKAICSTQCSSSGTIYCIFCLFVFLRQGLTMQPYLAWSWLSNLAWPWTYTSPPVSTSCHHVWQLEHLLIPFDASLGQCEVHLGRFWSRS